MTLRRRDKSSDSSRPIYSSLGSRIEHLLRLAEEQRDQIITEARQEAARIVDDARRQAGEILANARCQADQLAGATMTQPSAGQDSGFEVGGASPHPPITQSAPGETT
jgi:cell division septum initiation protein DivIVA